MPAIGLSGSEKQHGSRSFSRPRIERWPRAEPKAARKRHEVLALAGISRGPAGNTSSTIAKSRTFSSLFTTHDPRPRTWVPRTKPDPRHATGGHLNETNPNHTRPVSCSGAPCMSTTMSPTVNHCRPLPLPLKLLTAACKSPAKAPLYSRIRRRLFVTWHRWRCLSALPATQHRVGPIADLTVETLRLVQHRSSASGGFPALRCSFIMELLHDNTKSILAPTAEFGNDCGLARLADTSDSPIGRGAEKWKVLAAVEGSLVDIYLAFVPARPQDACAQCLSVLNHPPSVRSCCEAFCPRYQLSGDFLSL